MAQIDFNDDTDLFESSVDGENVDDLISSGDVIDVIEQYEENHENDDVQTDEILLDDPETGEESFLSPALPAEEETEDVQDAVDDLGIDLYSVAPSTSVFTPQTWQLNLSSNRSLGEHYLIWGERVYYGSSSSYWKYYCVVGRDITYNNDRYDYQDAEVYTFYSYNSQITYDVSVGSGSLYGSDAVVYSDLYFDYVATDPLGNSLPLIFVAFFFILFVLILVGGRRNV